MCWYERCWHRLLGIIMNAMRPKADIKRILPVTIAGVCAVIIFSSSPANALSLALAWDPPPANTDGTPLDTLVGYKVYCGIASGSYTSALDAGVVTEASVTGLVENTTYYFVLTAYNEDGTESAFSEELEWTATTSVLDADQDGLPDAWESTRGTAISTDHLDPAADQDGDGAANGQEFIAGTDPIDAASVLQVDMTNGSGEVFVRLLVPQAEGAGYENKRRLFTVEECEALTSGIWKPIPSFDRMLAINQTVTLAAQPLHFYRTRVWLE